VMTSEVNCYEDKRASLILLADKPYGICNCKPNTPTQFLFPDSEFFPKLVSE
jgi:hypothetical protein